MNISEIAKLAGVSKTTVSRILNNSEHVSDKTREAVLQVMPEVQQQNGFLSLRKRFAWTSKVSLQEVLVSVGTGNAGACLYSNEELSFLSYLRQGNFPSP